MDEDLQINSEIIWTFTNVESELLNAYPNGTPLSENLTTIDDLYTWKVDFYPNGKNDDSMNKIYVGLTLIATKEGVSDQNVDAECIYYVINKFDQRKNFIGHIERRNFISFHEESDSGFDSNEVLDKNANDLTVTISIKQYPIVKDLAETLAETIEDNRKLDVLEEDFKKVDINQLTTTEPIDEKTSPQRTVPGPIEEKIQNEPTVEEILTEPVVEKNVSEPIVEEIPNEPTIEEILTEPVVVLNVSETTNDENVSEPIVEEIQNEPTFEEIQNEQAIEEIQNELAIAEILTEPVVEVNVSETKTEENVSEPIVEEIQNEPIIKEIQNELTIAEILTEPVVEVNVSEIKTEENVSEQIIEEKKRL